MRRIPFVLLLASLLFAVKAQVSCQHDPPCRCHLEIKEAVNKLRNVDTESILQTAYVDSSVSIKGIEHSLEGQIHSGKCHEVERSSFMQFITKNADQAYSECILSGYDLLVLINKSSNFSAKVETKIEWNNLVLAGIDKLQEDCLAFSF